MKVSIATSAMNAERTIGCALFGVATQRLLSPKGRRFAIEQVVVDASRNGATQGIAGQFSTVSRVLSEPDRGIFDGMNKAIGLTSGDIVGILNADDFYFNEDTIGRVVDAMSEPGIEACFGSVVYVHSDRPTHVIRTWSAGSYDVNRFRHGWMPAHPAFFVRRSCYERYGLFREDMGSAGDYELMLRFLFRERIPAVGVSGLWVAMRAGGASNASLSARLRANRMDRKAWRANDLKPPPWMRVAKPLRKLSQFLPTHVGELKSDIEAYMDSYSRSKAGNIPEVSSSQGVSS